MKTDEKVPYGYTPEYYQGILDDRARYGLEEIPKLEDLTRLDRHTIISSALIALREKIGVKDLGLRNLLDAFATDREKSNDYQYSDTVLIEYLDSFL